MKVVLPDDKDTVLFGSMVVGSHYFTNNISRSTEFVMIFNGGEILYHRSSALFVDCFVICPNIEYLEEVTRGKTEKPENPSSNVSDEVLGWLRKYLPRPDIGRSHLGV